MINEELYRIRGVEIITFENFKKSLVFVLDNFSGVNA